MRLAELGEFATNVVLAVFVMDKVCPTRSPSSAMIAVLVLPMTMSSVARVTPVVQFSGAPQEPPAAGTQVF